MNFLEIIIRMLGLDRITYGLDMDTEDDKHFSYVETEKQVIVYTKSTVTHGITSKPKKIAEVKVENYAYSKVEIEDVTFTKAGFWLTKHRIIKGLVDRHMEALFTQIEPTTEDYLKTLTVEQLEDICETCEADCDYQWAHGLNKNNTQDVWIEAVLDYYSDSGYDHKETIANIKKKMGW